MQSSVHVQTNELIIREIKGKRYGINIFIPRLLIYPFDREEIYRGGENTRREFILFYASITLITFEKQFANSS